MNKNTTKLPLLILLGIIAFVVLIPTNVKASHVMGSDITWRHLQSDVYEITLKYYRDCKGIASTSSNNVRFSCTRGVAIVTYSQSLPIVGINNVSNNCLTSTSCGSTPNTAMSGDGVEEIVYRGTVNFNAGQLKAMRDSGCCLFRLDFGECCRNGEITTGSASNNFSTDSEIDLCNIKKSIIPNKDDSPTFKNIPIWNLCCNQTMTYNNGTFDANGDSLVFSLVPAQSAPNVSVPYNSPFNPVTWPMTGYCQNTSPCACNKSANPIRGFCFDTKTGDISFTPTDCSEVGIFVLKVEQFRREAGGNNWLYIGYTKRDLQWKVKSCINNIPSFEPVADTIVCAGDSVCIDVLARDKQFSNQNWIDTLDLTWNQSIPSAYFYQETHQIVITNGDTFSIREGKLCWQTKEEDARQAPYYFSFMAKDKACPVNMISSIGSSIRVLPNNQVVIDSIYGPDSTSQNGNRYYVLNSFQNYTYQWSIVNGTIDSGQGTTEVFVKWAGNPTGSGSLKLVYEPNNSQCGSKDSVEIMAYFISVPSILSNKGISIYPNPVGNMLHIESKVVLSKITILDSKGSLLFEGEYANQVDVSKFNAGVYILQLYDLEGNIFTHKFVKE